MNPIASFLARFKDIRPPAEEVARQLSQSIEEVLGIKVDATRIRISRRTAFIEGSSSLKSEVVLEQKEILKKLAAKGSQLDSIR